MLVLVSFIRDGNGAGYPSVLQVTVAFLWCFLYPLYLPRYVTRPEAVSRASQLPNLLCPFPALFAYRWFFPIIGHMGICTSTGVIRDFAGPYFVSVSPHLPCPGESTGSQRGLAWIQEVSENSQPWP